MVSMVISIFEVKFKVMEIGIYLIRRLKCVRFIRIKKIFDSKVVISSFVSLNCCDMG